jgi:uncharacterized protein
VSALGRAAPGTIRRLIIQSTTFCNIDCSYCYLQDRALRRRMSEETLAHVFSRVFGSEVLGTSLQVVWHAGEPLVLPVEFYRQAFRLARQKMPEWLELQHKIQTNGMLIDEAWCDLFRRWHVSIGVSIDGPAPLHDACRRTRRGQGTHARVMTGIAALRRFDIPFDVITVLTWDSLEFPDELFDFYVRIGVRSVGLNVEEIEGVNKRSSLDQTGVDARFRRFVDRFLTLLERHAWPFRVREFDWASAAVRAPRTAIPHNEQVQQFAIISVDVDGHWSTFSPELSGVDHPGCGRFWFGQASKSDPAAMAEHPSFKRVLAQIDEGTRACQRSCSYFHVCGGGAPADKLFENGALASTETMRCRLAVKGVFDVMKDHKRSVVA